MGTADSNVPAELPPIVLLVNRHRDELQRYSRCLEDAGLWVAATSVPDEALAAAEELKPDIIVADSDRAAATRGEDVVDALKQHPALGAVPVIALTSVPQAPVCADSVLIKPVAPSLLLQRTNELLSRARDARERSGASVEDGRSQVGQSSDLRRQFVERHESQPPEERMCPDCGSPLDWMEQGAIGGVTYDYYRWCLKGCGLYCFDRDRTKWMKLA